MSDYKDYNYTNEGFTCAHSYLLKPIKQLLSHEKNRLILDIGCGNGAISNALIDAGFNVYGIDASETGIQIANKKNNGRFFIHDLSAAKLPQEIQGMNFDTIISTEVIEHLYDPRKFIELCKKILAGTSQGELILSTPYHGYLKNVALALTGKMEHHFTVLWDGGHIKFWSKQTLSAVLEEYGFRVETFIGTGRLPYLWKSMIIKAKADK